VNALPGLRVGHATDADLKSGVTVVLPDTPAVAAVQVSGGAPASRETELLRPGNTVERVDAIVLSGGSAFGLAAADGVMAWLAARGRGFAVRDVHVPIVPGASLFDLTNGGDKSGLAPTSDGSLYRTLGAMACEAAGAAFEIGSVGAGTGATTADLKGGFGAAAGVLPDGALVAAYVVVNAVGRVTLGSTPHFRAAPFEVGKEFGGLGLPSPLPADAAVAVTKRTVDPLASTTLAVVATDCALSRGEAKRLAIAAHDGIALAIFPAHTPFDGDTVFALATGTRAWTGDRLVLMGLCAAATTTVARAIARAVHAAEAAPADVVPTWRERYHGAGRNGR
jgi:L-aminopeptidase/D-esterase-like protein